jgi:hypothetical protein
MKFLTFLVLVLNIQIGFSQDEAAAISRIETKRFEAMSKKDTNYLKFILSPNLVYTHSNGLVESRNDFIHSIATEKIVYQQIGIKEQKIKLYHKTAVVTGVIHVKGLLKEKEFEIDIRYTDVYIKTDDWKLVVWQSLKL